MTPKALKQFSICAFQMGNINSMCFSMHFLESIGTLLTAVEWERGIEVRYDQRDSFQPHLFSFFVILKLLNNDFEKLDLMFFCYREEGYFRFSYLPAFNIRACFVRSGLIDSTNISTNIETAMLSSFVWRDLLTEHLQVIFAELTLAIPPSTPLLTRAPISITESNWTWRFEFLWKARQLSKA